MMGLKMRKFLILAARSQKIFKAIAIMLTPIQMGSSMWYLYIIIITQLYQIQSNSHTMDRIKKIFQNPLEVAAAVSGLGLLGFYWFYARRQLFKEKKVQKNKTLELQLKQLSKQKRKNVVKIVITESKLNKLEFRGNLITRLKQFLQENKKQTLVNCAPLKLFDAGCETFLSTLTRDDIDDQIQFMVYFKNALQCELVIEKTVVDIERIKNENSQVFLICDTNSMDLKTRTDEELWQQFIEKQQLNEQDLINNYDVVFHIKCLNDLSSPKIYRRKSVDNAQMPVKFKQLETDDIKIKKAWENFHNYYQIAYNFQLSMNENVEAALKKIIEVLRPYLQSEVQYSPPQQKNGGNDQGKK